mgnify:CR=1 FL=1
MDLAEVPFFHLRTVDLFSGCGGLSLGFQNAGFDIVAAFDNWQPAIEVYKLNFHSPVYQRDLGTPGIAKEIAPYNADAIIGGPPCQDFSQAGKRSEDGGRAILTVRYGEIIAQCRPKIVVMENVPRARNSKALGTIRSLLKRSGYGLTERVMDASYCGVPQARKRLILIGILGAKDNVMERYLVEGLSTNPLTVRDYLGNSLDTEYYFRIPRSYDRRAIFSVDEPSMTIRGVDRPIPPNYKQHPNDAAPVEKARCLTPKERSLIQTFPDTFKFTGTKTDINQMIGNAVPVKMAEYVAKAINRYLMDCA